MILACGEFRTVRFAGILNLRNFRAVGVGVDVVRVKLMPMNVKFCVQNHRGEFLLKET